MEIRFGCDAKDKLVLRREESSLPPLPSPVRWGKISGGDGFTRVHRDTTILFQGKVFHIRSPNNPPRRIKFPISIYLRIDPPREFRLVSPREKVKWIRSVPRRSVIGNYREDGERNDRGLGKTAAAAAFKSGEPP